MAESNLARAQEAMSVRRVFGEPIQQDGVTIIPVARIAGGMGGGKGSNKESGEGSGFGFGMHAQPVGAFVIKDGKVSWVPTIDINRVIFGGQLVAIVFVMVLRSILKARKG